MHLLKIIVPVDHLSEREKEGEREREWERGIEGSCPS
jgi:hypothetical protein